MVTIMRLDASVFESSNPFSLGIMVSTSLGSFILRVSHTLLPSASTASLVGRVLSTTTRSATLFPVIIVPFLKLPTWRTSSIWQASKLPGETMRLSSTAWILDTKLVMAACSWSEGVRSWFLFRSAAWNASSTGPVAGRTGGKAGSANTMSNGTWGMNGGRGFIPGPPFEQGWLGILCETNISSKVLDHNKTKNCNIKIKSTPSSTAD